MKKRSIAALGLALGSALLAGRTGSAAGWDDDRAPSRRH